MYTYSITVCRKRRRSGRADKSASIFSSTVVGSSLARGVTSYPRKNSTNIEGDDMMTFAIIVVSGIVEIQFLILQ